MSRPAVAYFFWAREWVPSGDLNWAEVLWTSPCLTSPVHLNVGRDISGLCCNSHPYNWSLSHYHCSEYLQRIRRSNLSTFLCYFWWIPSDQTVNFYLVEWPALRTFRGYFLLLHKLLTPKFLLGSKLGCSQFSFFTIFCLSSAALKSSLYSFQFDESLEEPIDSRMQKKDVEIKSSSQMANGLVALLLPSLLACYFGALMSAPSLTRGSWP